MIIDTHVHVWDLNRAEYPWLHGNDSILNKTWRIEQLGDERKQAGITAGVLVQASGNVEDTDLMLETARNTAWISGVVGWLPLMDTEATQRMLEEKWQNEKYLKGARHQIHDEADAEWLLQPAVINSLQLVSSYHLPYDVVAVLIDHIETALKVSEKVPDLRMVFDHLSQPPISKKEKFGRWGELMKEAAQNKNSFAKISGLGTASGDFQNRKASDIKPYIEFALKYFGSDRCFCGGDWPVSLLANSYSGTWQTYKQILQELLPAEEQEKLLFRNAKSFYNLQIS